MQKAETYQKKLLEQTQYIYYETPISESTQTAYLQTPRHMFVKRYRDWGTREWREVKQANLEEHVATLYADRPLCLFGDDDDDVSSTISQPSFVLRMLDMLQIKRGHTVFELGAGSGWNAALMGHLVGPEGRVFSLELIPEVARMAAATIEGLGLDNVTIIEADGGDGYPGGAPYDRAIFTAGAHDLPGPFFEQMNEGSLLLMVIKNRGGGDNLFLLRKFADHFASLDSTPCGFVQMKGRHQVDSLEPIVLDSLPDWPQLRDKKISERPFWWGGKGRDGIRWRTLGIRSFLGIVEPLFQVFKTEKTGEQTREEHYFGLWDESERSLVIARDDSLMAYGNSTAEERLMEQVKYWVELGMPTAASFEVQIHPVGVALTPGVNQWVARRTEAQFLWSLNL